LLLRFLKEFKNGTLLGWQGQRVKQALLKRRKLDMFRVLDKQPSPLQD